MWRSLVMSCSLAALGLSACFSPVHVRPARLLAKGEHEAGVALSDTGLSSAGATWYTGTATDAVKGKTGQNLVNAMPEVLYHYGISDDLEAGVRVLGGGLLAEADAQYRFAKVPLAGGLLHAAGGMQVGMAAATATGGGRAVVPLRATYDFDDTWGVTLGGHAGYRWVKPAAIDAGIVVDQIDNTRWLLGRDGLTYGGGLAGDWRNDDLVLRLFAELDMWSGEIGAQGKLTQYSVMAWHAGIAAGFKWGKDAAALRKARDDLDSLTTPK